MHKLKKPPVQMFKHLGMLAAELLNEFRAEQDGYDDVDAFGAPSECYTDVARGSRRRQIEIMQEYAGATGFTVYELIMQFHLRVKYGWLYKTGLAHVLDEIETNVESDGAKRQMRKYANMTKLI